MYLKKVGCEVGSRLKLTQDFFQLLTFVLLETLISAELVKILELPALIKYETFINVFIKANRWIISEPV